MWWADKPAFIVYLDTYEQIANGDFNELIQSYQIYLVCGNCVLVEAPKCESTLNKLLQDSNYFKEYYKKYFEDYRNLE